MTHHRSMLFAGAMLAAGLAAQPATAQELIYGSWTPARAPTASSEQTLSQELEQQKGSASQTAAMNSG